MYTIADHASMLADSTRLDAYLAALRRAIHADSIVADIGAGLGTFALLAAQLGAARIYAIEPDDVIEVGRIIAAENGLASRITFIQARSTEVVLPERATVLVSDLHGTLPFFEQHLPAIADARARLLTEDGVLIPTRDRLWAAPVESPEAYDSHVTPWGDRAFGLDLEPLRNMLSNTWRRIRLASSALLADAACLATLDYRSLDTPNLDAEMSWTATRSGTSHGLCLWFDSELVDGVTLSNAPDQARAIYGQAFFPFAAPMALTEGDAISVKVQANLIGDDYVWRWTGRDNSGAIPRTQSTLHGVPLATRQLSKGAATHVPRLTTQGEIDLAVLSRLKESMPLGDIARELLERFPFELRDRNAALGRTGDLARKYSKG